MLVSQVSPKLTTVSRYPEREPGYYQAAIFGVTGNTPSFPDRGLGSDWDRLKTDPSQIHGLDHSWGNTQAVAARCDYVRRLTVRSDSTAEGLTLVSFSDLSHKEGLLTRPSERSSAQTL